MILQPLIPFDIARTRVGLVVASAIGLDDDHSLGAAEIGNPRADLMLAPELVAAESPISNVRPQDLLGFGRLLSKFAGTFDVLSVVAHFGSLVQRVCRPSPRPTPRGAGGGR